MKNKFIHTFFIFVIGITGCSEDKGNYSYKDINPITIDFNIEDAPFVVMEEEIQISPIIKDNKGEDINESDYEFKWRINDNSREGWNTKNFYWKTDEMIPQSYLILEVKDKKTGVVYLSSTQCKVSSVYDKTGFHVLSEKENKSILSYVTITRKKNGNYYDISEATVYYNIYEKENKEQLGTSPIGFHEHFCKDGTTIGQLLVLQKNGAVDVNGRSFKKEITMSELFKDGLIPTSPIVDAMFMTFVDILQDEKGHLYSRFRSSNALFHSNKFLPTPLTYDGKTLENCQLILSRFQNQKFNLVFDKKNSRLLTILDGATFDTKIPLKEAGKISVVPAMPVNPNDAPIGFVPLNESLRNYEVLHIGYHLTSSNFDVMGYSMILKDKAGNYFWQDFEVKRNGVTSIFTIQNCRFNKIIGLPSTPTLCYRLPHTNNCLDIYIAIGKQLYIFDTNNPNDAAYPYTTFESDITSINTEITGSEHAGVGLKNGNFYIINAKKGINVPKDRIIQYELPTEYNFGEVKAVKYRLSKSWI